jgi:hypothetical protein
MRQRSISGFQNQAPCFLPRFFQFCLAFLAFSTLAGCGDNPGKWPVEKVSQKVAESLELSEVSLSATERGLEGSGLRADGETVSLVVTQHPDLGEIRWDAKGDRGFVEEGYFQLR